MHTPPAELQFLQVTTDLDDAIGRVEQALAALGDALKSQDADATGLAADALQQHLQQAVTQVARAAGRGALPPVMRRRLALASGQVAAQREAVARASAGLDRAIDILLPQTTAPVYGAAGASRGGLGGSLIA